MALRWRSWRRRWTSSAALGGRPRRCWTAGGTIPTSRPGWCRYPAPRLVPARPGGYARTVSPCPYGRAVARAAAGRRVHVFSASLHVVLLAPVAGLARGPALGRQCCSTSQRRKPRITCAGREWRGRCCAHAGMTMSRRGSCEDVFARAGSRRAIANVVPGALPLPPPRSAAPGLLSTRNFEPNSTCLTLRAFARVQPGIPTPRSRGGSGGHDLALRALATSLGPCAASPSTARSRPRDMRLLRRGRRLTCRRPAVDNMPLSASKRSRAACRWSQPTPAACGRS